MKHKERTQSFVETIWKWFIVHKRTLPWRDLPDRDPAARAYKILVSEIMLQQTQVPRVIVTYRSFLERFATIQDLAEASNKDVLIAWRGMGYNSRALRLRDAARTVVGDLNGSFTRLFVNSSEGVRVNELTNQRVVFPQSMEGLTSIKGIGPYTAAAIRNFAFNIPTPCIDTNIRRILHRTFVGPENSDGMWEKDDEKLLKIAADVLVQAMLQKGDRGIRGERGERGVGTSSTSLTSSTSITSEWHAALMDFGSLVQTKRNPKWDICPLTREGIMKTQPKQWSIANRQGSLQVKKSKEPGRHVGSTFIPNRIFRGRIVEALRDAPRGLTLHDIGAQIAIDWDPAEHREWLTGILQKLTQEMMLEEKRGKYVLG